jgi:DNA-binding transcriptional regulator YiaG
MRTDATAHLRRTETLDANGATPYMDAVTFAELLRRWRGEREQSEAAAALGVSLRTYQNWEQSHRTPRGLALESVLSRIGHFAKLSETKSPAGAPSKEKRTTTKLRTAIRVSGRQKREAHGKKKDHRKTARR